MPAAIAGVVASLPLLPLLLGYASRHAAFGLARSYAESRVYAADVAGLISISHREWLWSGWFPMTYGEGSIFPGVTVAGLAIVAVLSRVRPAAERRARWSSGLLVASGVLMLIVLARIFAGSSGWHLGAMTLPPFRPYRVFTFAVLLLMAAALTAERFRSNWRRRDPVIFYAVAAVIFWLLALGPEPTWAGERILTYGPYRLFFELHVPAVVRVTARAWLVVLPCLAVLAAFGTMWLTDRFPRHRHIVLVLCAALVIAESWFVDGTKAAPLPLPAGVIPMGATVLDVPFDDPFVNAAAQYRAVLGGYRTINGYSGYEAAHLTRLRMAFKEMRYDSIDDYHRTSDLYVIVRPDADPIFARWLATRGVDARPGQSQSVVYRLRSAR